MSALILAVAIAIGTPTTTTDAQLSGKASWYHTAGLTGAAGPDLRAALGKGWRGSWVRVSSGGRSVTVQLTDWCQCYRGESRERLIDLSDKAFARLAPLSQGIARISISFPGTAKAPAERVIEPPATHTYAHVCWRAV